VHNQVKKIWFDKGVQKAFQDLRYEFHVFDGASHFFSNLDRLAPPNYEPTIDDILMCRRKTTGLVSCVFTHKLAGQDVKMILLTSVVKEMKEKNGKIYTRALMLLCLYLL